MKTVVVTNSIVGTIIQVCLISSAAHVIQEDSSNSTNEDAIVVNNSECYCICKLCKKINSSQLSPI